MSKHHSQRYLGIICVFISATMYGTLAIFAKLGYASGLTPALLLILRFGFAFAIMAVYLGLFKRVKVLDLSPLSLIQGIAFSAASILYFSALKALPAGIACMLFYLYPIIVTVAAAFIYREKVAIRLVVSLVLAMAGIGMISGFGGSMSGITARGLVLAITSSLCYSAFGLLGQKTLSRSEPTTLTTTFSLLCVLVLAVLFPREFVQLPHLNGEQLLIGITMAVFNTVLPMSLFLAGVRIVGASTSSMVSTAEPAVTVILAYLILHEVLAGAQFFGVIMVLAAILLAVYRPPNDSPAKGS